MKKLFALALLSLLFVCCKSEPENKEAEETTETVEVAALSFSSEDVSSELRNKLDWRAADSILSPQASQIYRIEEKVSVGWHGVRGCCDQKTINSNVQKRFDEWAGKKMLENPNLMVLNYGAPGAKVSCTYRNSGFPDNRRSCTGGCTLACYIEFYRP